MNITSNTIKPFTYISIICILFAFISCKKDKKKEILTEKIARVEFVDDLELDGGVESVRSSTITCPRRIEGKIVFLVEEGTKINAGDIVCKLECDELQERYDETLRELELIQAERTKTEANLKMQFSLLDAQVKSNAAQTSITNLDSLQLKYLTPKKRRIKELELKKTEIERSTLVKKLNALEIINRSQIASMDQRIMQFENRIASARQQLDDLSLKSLQNGVAFRNRSYMHTGKVQEGDLVYGGMPLILIPDYSEMKVIIMASESSYKQIDEGDSVEYSFDAMPNVKTKGKILMKAPVGEPVKENSKVKAFRIESSMEKAPILPDPGLTAHCRIFLKRVQDTIVIPQLAIFDEDSMKIVYVKKDKNYEKRQIKVGSTSLEKAIVTAGLKTGEQLSLIKPSTAQIKMTTLLPKPVKNQKIRGKTNKPDKTKNLKTQTK